jgi:hypothetical protein
VPADLLANDTDADGDTLVVDSVSGAVNGTVTLANGIITFTPDTDYNGAASFTYAVSDGLLLRTGTVSLYVGTPVQSSQGGGSGQPAGGVSPQGGSPLLPGPTNVDGTLALPPLTPLQNVVDLPEGGGGSPATVDSAYSLRLVTLASGQLVIPVASLFSGDTSFTFLRAFNATHGTVTYDPVTDQLTFVPQPGFTGVAGFDYEAGVDGRRVIRHVTVIIAPQPEVGTSQTTIDLGEMTAAGTSLVPASVLLAAAGPGFHVVDVTNAAHGMAVYDAATGLVRFVAEANYAGPAGYDVTVSDGTTTKTIHIDVNVIPPDHASLDGISPMNHAAAGQPAAGVAAGWGMAAAVAAHRRAGREGGERKAATLGDILLFDSARNIFVPRAAWLPGVDGGDPADDPFACDDAHWVTLAAPSRSQDPAPRSR